MVAYLTNHKSDLSEDSLKRINKNPLRILDSKDAGDQKILKNAPLIKDSLNDDSRIFFEKIKEGLEKLDIPYTLNDRLVRGLDYYTHTAFEFTSTKLGAQNTILAGGRYDNLIEVMGGPQTPGIGWAAGLERLELLVENVENGIRPISIVPVDQNTMNDAFSLADNLRRNGFNVDLGYSGNLSKRMRRANKINARIAIILGEEEIRRRVGLVKDMDTSDQTEVSLEQIHRHLDPYK